MPDIKDLRILISCGGTGGHFNPGLGIAKELIARGGQAILFLGGKHVPAQMETAKKAGVPAVSFHFVRPDRNPAALFGFGLSLIRGYRLTKRLIREHAPHAVLAMGSSVSLPPILAAWSSHVPVFLHEGNAKVGKANRKLSRFAKEIELSFPAVNADALHCPSFLTGFPLRKELTDRVLSKAEGIAKVNELFHVSFSPEKPTILVFGGSLGARSINENFDVDPADPRSRELQVIHLAGPGKTEPLKEKYRNFPCPVLLLEGTGEMSAVYAASDVVISRSGGSTVSELAFFGKYAFLVPYPYAAEHHQDDNAAWLASAGAAEIVNDSACSPELFRSFAARFLKDPQGFVEKGQKARSIARPEAASEVLKRIAEGVFG